MARRHTIAAIARVAEEVRRTGTIDRAACVGHHKVLPFVKEINVVYTCGCTLTNTNPKLEKPTHA